MCLNKLEELHFFKVVLLVMQQKCFSSSKLELKQKFELTFILSKMLFQKEVLVVYNSPFRRWDMRMRTNFGDIFSIFPNNINRWRSSTSMTNGDGVLKYWVIVFPFSRVQQITWNRREVHKGSFHVFSLVCLLSSPTMSV